MIKILKEEFLDAKRINNQYTEIFITPTYKEFRSLISPDSMTFVGEEAVRGITFESGESLMWGGHILHHEFINDIYPQIENPFRLKGNAKYQNDRNFFTIIVDQNNNLFLGDMEKVYRIIEKDKLNFSLAIENFLKKHSYIKLSSKLEKDIIGVIR